MREGGEAEEFERNVDEGGGDQSFATPKYASWDIELVIFRKQKTQKEPLTFPLTV